MDEVRFRLLYEQAARPLLSYVLRVTGDKALADDVLQESCLRLLQADLTDVSDDKLKSYLFSTATNILRDEWRRKRKERIREGSESAEASTIHDQSATDLRYTFQMAFDDLSPQQRSLLWLAYVEGYQHKEIAAMLKLRAKSVRVLLFRARHKLSNILTAMGIGKEYYEQSDLSV